MSELEIEEEFELEAVDVALIHCALETAQRMLQREGLTSSQEQGLKTAIAALERLPYATRGVNVAFGAVIDLELNDEVKDGFRYLLFYVTSEAFGITRGGMADYGFGMDTFISDGYDVYLCREPGRFYPAHGARDNILNRLEDIGRVEVDDQSIYSE